LRNSCKSLPKPKDLTSFTLTSIARPFKITSPFAAPAARRPKPPGKFCRH
jgi:hypothetical protein